MNSYHSVVQQCLSILDGALSLECTITSPPVQQPHAQFYTVPALPLDSTGCFESWVFVSNHILQIPLWFIP